MLVGKRKLGGILTEVVGTAVVVGIGLNVSLRDDELPVPTATSLAIEGSVVVDRDPVLRAVLREFERRYVDLARASGDADGCVGSPPAIALPAPHSAVRFVWSCPDPGCCKAPRSTSIRTVGWCWTSLATARPSRPATSSTSADRSPRTPDR